MARDAIDSLESYHAHLLKQSQHLPLFSAYDNPMPITFGSLEAGVWPASAPSSARLAGVLGFLPNKTRNQICHEIRHTLLERFAADDFELSFTYRHDCTVLPPEHELPQAILQAARTAGLDAKIDALTCGSDTSIYHDRLGIPTVVYGPGTTKVAHAKDEHIRISDILDAASVLTHVIWA